MPPITDKRRSYNREYGQRVHRVSVTLTAEEYRILKTRAKTAGIRPTSFARELVVSAHGVSDTPPEVIQAELQEIRFLLRNAANNINQIAHNSNIIQRLVDENGLLLEIRKMEEAVFSWVKKERHPR